MKDELRKGSGPYNVVDRMFSTQSKPIATAYSLNHTAIQQEAQRTKNIYKFPATRQKAQLHQHVNKFGYRSPASEISKERVCRCCGYTVNIEQIPLCGSMTPLKETNDELFPEPRQISADSYIFLHFIKMTIGYLLLRALFGICFKLLANSNSHYCISYPQQCTLKGLIVLSLWSQVRLNNQQLLQIQSVLNVVYLIVAILFLIYYRCVQHSQFINLHAKKYNQDDFTIMVQNIPFFPFIQNQPYDNIEQMPQYYEMLRLSIDDMNNNDVLHSNNPNIVVTEAIRLFFNRQANKWRKKVERKGIQEPQQLTGVQLNFYDKIKSLTYDNIQKPVTSVNLCFDLGDLKKVSDLREQIMKEHIEHYKNDGYVDESSPNYPPNQVSLLAQKQIEVLKRYAATTNPELTLSHFLKTAFVSFEYEEYKDYFIRQHQSDLKLLYDDQTCLHIKQAPAVQDINWFNLNISDAQRAKAIFKSCIALLLLIGTSLLLIWLIQYWRIAAAISVVKLGTKRMFQLTHTGVIFILAATFIIKIFILIFEKVIDYSVSESQFKAKSTELIATLTQKIVVEFIFVLAAFLMLSEFGSGKAKSWDEVSVIVMLLIAKSVVMRTIINLLNPLRLKQLLSLKWFYSQSSSNLFQIQLNKTFQLPTFDVPDRCTFYITWLLVSSFFFAVAGVSSLILLAIFLANYWIDKWNLLRRTSNPVSMDSRLGYLLLIVLHCDLFVFAFGNFTTMQMAIPTSLASRNHQSEVNRILHLHLSYSQIAIVGLIITTLYVFVNLVTPKSFCRDYKTKTKTYSEVQHMFRYRYWTENPASRMAQQGSYQFLKNTKETERSIPVPYKNYSLPLAQMKSNLEEKVEVKKAQKVEKTQKDTNVKTNNNMQHNLALNLQEIDLSKAYRLKKGDEGSGSRSSRKRLAGK